MKRVLFVCLGNICRSPLAEAIFNQRVKENGLEALLEGDSCGTANYHIGDPPDPRTIQIAVKNGIPVSHLGRQFQASDFKKFDIILPMDGSNLNQLLRLASTQPDRDKIKLMRSFDPQGRDADVQDPYYGDERDFADVYEILDRSIRDLIHSLQ